MYVCMYVRMYVCVYICMQVFAWVCPGGFCQQVSVCNCRHATPRTQEGTRRLALSTWAANTQAAPPTPWVSLAVREDSSFCNTEVQNASVC
jgi:hypothetical protein